MEDFIVDWKRNRALYQSGNVTAVQFDHSIVNGTEESIPALDVSAGDSDSADHASPSPQQISDPLAQKSIGAWLKSIQTLTRTCLKRTQVSAKRQDGFTAMKRDVQGLLLLLAKLSNLSTATNASKTPELIVDPVRKILVILLDALNGSQLSSAEVEGLGNKLLKGIDKAFQKQPILQPLLAKLRCR